ncbi:MAG: hypothetical protein HZC55_10240 [Verrucomicrobia bacterium]|nr:hypothetical protein [Verrucomicrobiota bacterium]
MTPLDAIADHHKLCDELHQLAMDENRFLRQHQRSPDSAFLARKQQMLGRLDESLLNLRAIPASSARGPELRAELEKTRSRILQILQLDKENEQLLLRFSLTRGRPETSPAAASSASMLQKIYARCS